MQESNYPLLGQHRQEQDLFTGRVVVMHEEHHTGKRPLPFDVLSFLNSWLTNHILDTDGQFGRFMDEKKATKPIKPEAEQAKK